MCDGFLWHRRGLRVLAQHPAKPAQRLAEITSHSSRSPEIVGDQPNVVFIIPFLCRLQRSSKFPFSRTPLSHGNQAQSAGIPTLYSNCRTLTAELQGPIQI